MVSGPLDVAVVTPRYPPNASGGGGRSVQLLAEQLGGTDRIGSVTVYAFDGDDDRERTVTVRRLGDVPSAVTELQNLLAFRKLRGRLGDHDIVHGYNMELHPAIGYLSTREDVPSVATLNSYHFFRSSVTNTTATGLERLYEVIGYPTTGRLLRRAIARIDVLVALSRAIERIYRENGYENARIERFNNMADPSFSVPEDVEPNEGEYTLLYVGSLTENKGVSHLIRAMGSLPDGCRLRVAGDGPLADSLVDLAAEVGVRDRVVFEGWVDYEQVGRLYATADLFVHPGVWPEPFNRTVLEAMQAGLPVVCTSVGGPPEAVSHDELLCEPGDPAALAAAVTRARSMETDIGTRNREYVQREHAPTTVVPQLVDLYEEIVRHRHR